MLLTSRTWMSWLRITMKWRRKRERRKKRKTNKEQKSPLETPLEKKINKRKELRNCSLRSQLLRLYLSGKQVSERNKYFNKKSKKRRVNVVNPSFFIQGGQKQKSCKKPQAAIAPLELHMNLPAFSKIEGCLLSCLITSS